MRRSSAGLSSFHSTTVTAACSTARLKAAWSGISRIDAKTHEVKAYPFPKEWQSASTQASMVSPQHSDVDGKVWSNNQEDHYGYRLDVATGHAVISLQRFEAGETEPFRDAERLDDLPRSPV